MATTKRIDKVPGYDNLWVARKGEGVFVRLKLDRRTGKFPCKRAAKGPGTGRIAWHSTESLREELALARRMEEFTQLDLPPESSGWDGPRPSRPTSRDLARERAKTEALDLARRCREAMERADRIAKIDPSAR